MICSTNLRAERIIHVVWKVARSIAVVRLAMMGMMGMMGMTGTLEVTIVINTNLVGTNRMGIMIPPRGTQTVGSVKKSFAISISRSIMRNVGPSHGVKTMWLPTTNI